MSDPDRLSDTDLAAMKEPLDRLTDGEWAHICRVLDTDNDTVRAAVGVAFGKKLLAEVEALRAENETLRRRADIADIDRAELRQALVRTVAHEAELVALLDPDNDKAVERACETLHDAYEAAAASAGWETQAASRGPWFEVPMANRVTMRVAVRRLFTTLCAAEKGEG